MLVHERAGRTLGFGDGSAYAGFFGDTAHRLFGWVHLPPGGRARGAAVLCAPFAREQSSAQETYRELATALAEAGVIAVRFDYPGTGDSFGDDDTVHGLETWRSAVNQAIALAREAGVTDVVTVGMRMGALLAADAAVPAASLAGVVMWDPCLSGRRFVREQRALSLARRGAPAREDGILELPGAVIGERLAAGIQSLELGELSPVARRILVCCRDASAEHEVRSCFGPIAEWASAPGQRELLEVEPVEQTVPRQAIATISSFVVAACSSGTVSVELPHLANSSTGRSSEGVPVRERIVALGPAGLFGIEAARATGSVKGLPTVVMLNSGTDSHVGPSRLWVELSRRWAALGVRSVRLDLSGLGESAPRPGQPRQVVYSPFAFDDVAEAAASVSPTDPRDVVLLGLCSGAYQALESAFDLEPAGVLAVNPAFRFLPPEARAGGIDPRRRFCQPPGGVTRLVRNLPLEPVLGRIRGPAWKVANRLRGDQSAAGALASLVGRGVECYCVGGPDELAPLLAGAARRRSRTTGQLSLQVIDGLDHGLVPLADRERVIALLGATLARLLGGRSSRQAASA